MQAAAVGRPASYHAAHRPSALVNLRHPGQRLSLSSRVLRREQRHQHHRGCGGASMVMCSVRDPWKTLGVGQNADEKEIKRAHRKLVLKYHPDLTKDDPGAEGHFLLIQEAYEILMGRRRGKELDASADGNSWSFHDWYWRFSMSKRWGRNKKARGSTNPFASEAPPPGAERTQWKSQLDGLKRKAATKRAKQWQQGAQATAAASTAETAAAAEAKQQAQPAEAQPFAASEERAGSRAASRAAQRQRAEQAPGAQAAAAASSQEARGQQAAAADGGVAHQSAPGEPSQRQQRNGDALRYAANGASFTARPGSGRAAAAAASSAASSQDSEPADSGAQQGEQQGEQGQAGRRPRFNSHPLSGHYQPQHHPPLHHAQHPEHHQQHWQAEQMDHVGGEAASDPELMLKGLLSQMVGRVTRLGEESGGVLQNHVVRLARRASQLGQHLQVQLVRLRALSAANQAGRHHTELHVEFEQTVRSWQQSGHAPGAGSWQHTAAAHHAEQPAAGEGAEQEPRSSGEEGGDAAGPSSAADAEYVRRSRRFVNDGQVRERVNSQLAGLRRRASIRQEFVVEE